MAGNTSVNSSHGSLIGSSVEKPVNVMPRLSRYVIGAADLGFIVPWALLTVYSVTLFLRNLWQQWQPQP
jgi:hypothetical protein